MRVEPTELTAAIVSGWALAWAMTALGIDPIPSVMVGLITAAWLIGKYRRRWAPPQTAA